ncbi:hypothetical protein H4219_000957 [Mycoemilia scoparia]|uniref:Tr-type G domain-containing protein n=1 Tax=Mycoemilia scoparia TaxID=417184 RepID=A0A9W8A1Y6_9FUNG|nr:hypothetical protein H4219_000957 [Mycoemilia scoparia]
MDGSNYDEFGNYLGPNLPSSDDENSALGSDSEISEESFKSDASEEEDNGFERRQDAMDVEVPQNQVVLHEDKSYYPDASEVYGQDVENIVQEEDTQLLTEPIIAPIKDRKFLVDNKDLPETLYPKEFLLDLLDYPIDVRNVAIAGHLHHGKTSLVDMLIASTHTWKEWESTTPVATVTTNTPKSTRTGRRYTDTHILERDRGIGIKASPMTLAMANTKGKNFALNIIDIPGHVNFNDEMSAGLRLADGLVLVVDAVEGVMMSTKQAIKLAIMEGLPITLVINKVDRLIFELKLPPNDAYYKLKHTIDEVNSFIGTQPSSDPGLLLSPNRGNVCFASSDYGWCFSLESFAQLYIDTWGKGIALSHQDLAKRLWGDIYFSKEKRTFVRKAGAGTDDNRSFVHFVLEPLYKLHSQVIGEDEPALRPVLESLGIYLKKKEYGMNVRELLRRVMIEFFGNPTGFVDMCTTHIKSPVENARKKAELLFSGSLDSSVGKSICSCDPSGPLMIQVTKLYPSTDGSELNALGRIYSGTVRPGQKVRVMGESYTLGDDEEISDSDVTTVSIFESRYSIPVSGLGAGNWVYLGGIDNTIIKTATIADVSINEGDLAIFRPLNILSIPVMKIAIEPVNPTELPKMLSGLRKINKTYPAAITRVEESGEHVLLGTGELYMDCMMHDLRKLYSEIEIKVADPVVTFRETVVEMSSIKCYAHTSNNKNKITMIAEPLDKGIAEDIEENRVSLKWPVRQVGEYFESNYGWDILAGRSIWAFGPDANGPNTLSDDTLPGETNKSLLRASKESFKQGFLWATREGPLCDEPIRNTRFRILGVDFASDAVSRGGGHLIPAVRRVCYSSFLTATPRLMEPMYSVEIQAPADCVAAVYTVLARRRGHVTQDTPKPGSPLYTVMALIPVIDSFGFETDLRAHTNGQAFCLQMFDHWQVVPGDPLDEEIVLRPLEPSPAQHLARDFMTKTRRRKGLSDSVVISKYFDDPALLEAAQSL